MFFRSSRLSTCAVANSNSRLPLAAAPSRWPPVKGSTRRRRAPGSSAAGLTSTVARPPWSVTKRLKLSSVPARSCAPMSKMTASSWPRVAARRSAPSMRPSDGG